MQKIYDARRRRTSVPVLMHWQFEMYNYGFERFRQDAREVPDG